MQIELELIIVGLVAAAALGGLLLVAWGLRCAAMRREKLPQELIEFWEQQLEMQREQVEAIGRLADKLAGVEVDTNDTPEWP